MVGVQNKKLTKSTRAHGIVQNRISTTSTGTPETVPTQFRGPAWRMKAQEPRPKKFRRLTVAQFWRPIAEPAAATRQSRVPAMKKAAAAPVKQVQTLTMWEAALATQFRRPPMMAKMLSRRPGKWLVTVWCWTWTSRLWTAGWTLQSPQREQTAGTALQSLQREQMQSLQVRRPLAEMKQGQQVWKPLAEPVAEQITELITELIIELASKLVTEVDVVVMVD